jgi:hypothetical protein
VEAAYFLTGVQHIIGMPGHIIIAGMPMAIIDIMRSQYSFIMSIGMPSIGFMVQTMPAGVISHVIWHIIIGIGIGIPSMPPIIDIGDIGMPIMLPIMGIILDIMPGIIGIMLPIWFIGICIAGIMVETPSQSSLEPRSRSRKPIAANDRSTLALKCRSSFQALQGPQETLAHF